MDKRDGFISGFFYLLILYFFLTTRILLAGCGSETNGNGLIYQGPSPDLYWCFANELISENTIEDVMGTYDGTKNAGVTTGGSGKVDEAVALDGSTGYITAAPPKANTLTVSVWINPASVPMDHPQIFCQGSGTEGFTGCYLRWDNTERVRLALYDQGGTIHFVYTSGPINMSEWTHIVATVSIVGGNAEIAIFCDGEFQESNTFSATSINYGDKELCLGMNTWGTHRYFDGSIDEFALFIDEVLSDEDIKALYDAGAAGQPIVEH